jgi:hypothetical protein
MNNAIIDQTQFKQKPSDGYYRVYIAINGDVCLHIKADSEEEAKTKTMKIINAKDWQPDDLQVGEAKISYIRKNPPMFLVKRNGGNICTSHLQEGDEPRNYDESGF